MKIYLNYINPIVSIAVLLLCVWASMNGDNGFRPMQMIQGGIPTYFLAKGIFCSAALFLVGKVVSLLRENDAK